MLIKPFTNQIETINDIGNMKGARRFIIIYKYKTPKSAVLGDFPDSYPMENVYGDTMYGIYLVNTSTIDGIDFIVPKKYNVYSRNGYRGSCRDALNPDGRTINKNAIVTFYSGSYSNRLHNKERVNELYTSFNTLNSIKTDFNSESLMINLLRSPSAIPYPCFYNIEDQARYAPDSYKDADFVMNYASVPQYRLNDLIDDKTTVIVTNVDGDTNNIIVGNGINDNSSNYLEFGKTKTEVDLSKIRRFLLDIFVNCFEITMDSIFSGLYFIFDLQTGLFTVPTNGLKLKYKWGITKEILQGGYVSVVESASDLSSTIHYQADDVFMQALPQYKENGGEIFDLIPERLYIYSSLSTCSLKLHCKSLYNINNGTDCTMHMNTISTGDTDDISQYYCGNMGLGEIDKEHFMPEF